MGIKVENPSPTDYEEILYFLEESYNHSKNYFLLRYPQVMSKEAMDYSNIFILREKGRIISLVRIFPQVAVMGERKAEIGGIGSVATHPDYRGRGYMRILMNHCLREMEKRGYVFSILGGDRQRYNFWGYESCGINLLMHFSLRSMEKSGYAQRINVQRFQKGEKVLEKVKDAHEKFTGRIERSREVYRYLLEKRIHTHLWFTEEEGKFAYLVGEGEEKVAFIEIGGEENLWIPLIYSVMKRYNLESVHLHFPYLKGKLPFLFPAASGSFSLRPSCMIKILSFSKIINFIAGENLPSDFILKVRETGEEFRGKKGKINLELSEREWAQVIFGPFFPCILPSELHLYFPGEFYRWPLDCV